MSVAKSGPGYGVLFPACQRGGDVEQPLGQVGALVDCPSVQYGVRDDDQYLSGGGETAAQSVCQSAAQDTVEDGEHGTANDDEDTDQASGEGVGDISTLKLLIM